MIFIITVFSLKHKSLRKIDESLQTICSRPKGLKYEPIVTYTACRMLVWSVVQLHGEAALQVTDCVLQVVHVPCGEEAAQVHHGMYRGERPTATNRAHDRARISTGAAAPPRQAAESSAVVVSQKEDSPPRSLVTSELTGRTCPQVTSFCSCPVRRLHVGRRDTRAADAADARTTHSSRYSQSVRRFAKKMKGYSCSWETRLIATERHLPAVIRGTTGTVSQWVRRQGARKLAVSPSLL